MKILKKMDLPPLWGFLCLLGVVMANLIVPQPNLSNIWTFLLGLICIICAIILFIWARFSFKYYQTTIHPKKLPTTLMTDGAFGFTRNPIYMAFILTLLGVAFLLGSMWGFVFVFILFFVLRNRFVINEEANLISLFGEDAENYLKNVRRW